MTRRERVLAAMIIACLIMLLVLNVLQNVALTDAIERIEHATIIVPTEAP